MNNHLVPDIINEDVEYEKSLNCIEDVDTEVYYTKFKHTLCTLYLHVDMKWFEDLNVVSMFSNAFKQLFDSRDGYDELNYYDDTCNDATFFEIQSEWDVNNPMKKILNTLVPTYCKNDREFLCDILNNVLVDICGVINKYNQGKREFHYFDEYSKFCILQSVKYLNPSYIKVEHRTRCTLRFSCLDWARFKSLTKIIDNKDKLRQDTSYYENLGITPCNLCGGDDLSPCDQVPQWLKRVCQQSNTYDDDQVIFELRGYTNKFVLED